MISDSSSTKAMPIIMRIHARVGTESRNRLFASRLNKPVNQHPGLADYWSMLHPWVQAEMYGTRRDPLSRTSSAQAAPSQIPRRHVIAAVLMMMILGSWAMDMMHVRFFPRSAHEAVASFLDSQRGHCPTGTILPSIDSTIAHNPLDDSPISFGSVLMLGGLCTIGLVGTAFGSLNRQNR